MTKDSKVRTLAVLAVVAVVAGVMAVGVTYAQQPPAGGAGPRMGGPGMMMGGRGMMAFGPLGMLRRGLAELGLSDQQKEQIKGIVQSHRDDVKGLREQMQQARRALMNAVVGDADEATIRARSADVAKVQADLAVLGAQVRKQVFATLTPEQQTKAKAMRENMLARRERFRERREKDLF